VPSVDEIVKVVSRLLVIRNNKIRGQIGAERGVSEVAGRVGLEREAVLDHLGPIGTRWTLGPRGTPTRGCMGLATT
jgi:hypothetical protein